MSPILGIWASAQQGAKNPISYDSIATTTLGSAQQTITFSSIPQTYTHLQLRVMFATTPNGSIQFNGDSTSTNYRSHYLTGDGASISSGTITSYAGAFAFYGISTTANTFGIAIVDILEYTNTNKYKVTRSLNGIDKNGSGGLDLDSGLWLNTAAVTSLSAYSIGGTFAAGSSFALYGIKG